MTKSLLFINFLLIHVCQSIGQSVLPVRHNPRIDFNLSPIHNVKINPLHNSTINPKTNWNINPSHNNSINPVFTSGINPLSTSILNPIANEVFNPMFSITLHPKNPAWKGNFLFDNNDNLIGFISSASQNILLCFDLEGNWTCYFIKTPKGTYNEFSLQGHWTGEFLCYDSNGGYNLFNKDGEWTGKHIK